MAGTRDWRAGRRMSAVATVALVAASCGGAAGGSGAAPLPAVVATNPYATPSAVPAVPRVDPIRATFFESLKETSYTVAIYPNEGTAPIRDLGDPRAAFDVRFVGPDCGTTRLASFSVGDTSVYYSFVWSHPHPPCDATTDHSTTTITITVSNGAGTVACTYQGAASGTSPNPCTKL